MKTPSADDMHIAAQWLDIYEGAEDAEACKRVSEWLIKKADDQELKASLRGSGVTVGMVRHAERMRARK